MLKHKTIRQKRVKKNMKSQGQKTWKVDCISESGGAKTMTTRVKLEGVFKETLIRMHS